jgi:hypothetical protein
MTHRAPQQQQQIGSDSQVAPVLEIEERSVMQLPVVTEVSRLTAHPAGEPPVRAEDGRR